MYGYDVRGSRNNTQEHVLSARNVGNLGLRWSYQAHTYGVPAVVNGVVYVSSSTGAIALNEKDGSLKWHNTDVGFVSDSPLVTQNTVVLGDWAGDVWGLDAAMGTKKWQVHPNVRGGSLVAIYGSATAIGDNVVIGVASNEEQNGVSTFEANGSVVMLNAQTGSIVWQTYMIPPTAYADGWRGASVWSTPTYDVATNTVFVTTGNYFQAGTSDDPGVEDAVIALDGTTGAFKWVNQLVAGDIWNGTIVPGPDNPDADIGDSAKLISLPGGKTAVGVGSKNGFYFEMDAATGAPLNGPDGLRLEVGGVLGGLFATGAVDQKNGVEFSNGINWPTNYQPNDPGWVGGDLYAVSLDGKSVLWDFKTPAPAASGVAIANGVVYFKTLDGMMYALNARAKDAEHALIASFPVGDGFSAPSVVNGQLFVGGGRLGISAYGLKPRAAATVHTRVVTAGAALLTAEIMLAAGGLTRGQVNQVARSFTVGISLALGDLAKTIGLKPPSTTALSIDFKTYATAVNANDVAAAQTALDRVKADLQALFLALSNPMVNRTQLNDDLTTLFASLDKVLSAQQAHDDLSVVSADSATAFGSLMIIFNDLMAGRYGMTFF